MPDASAYCTARTVESVEDPDGDTHEEETSTGLATFDEVVAFLERFHDWQSSFLIEQWAFEPATARQNLRDLGGFIVILVNRRGSKVEVGVGRDFWFLRSLTPYPGHEFSDHPEVAGSLDFHLSGRYYHDFKSDQLVSRQACLATLGLRMTIFQGPVDPEPASTFLRRDSWIIPGSSRSNPVNAAASRAFEGYG